MSTRNIPRCYEQVEKLESFTSAMADGVVEKKELEAQEQRLAAAMKAARARAERRAAREGDDRAGGAHGVQRDAAAARAQRRAGADRVRGGVTIPLLRSRQPSTQSVITTLS